MGLLKTLFYLVIIYYVLKFLARLFAPFLVKKAAETMQKKAEQKFNTQQKQHTTSVKEGETIIDKKPIRQNTSKNDVGDYVDFEEID